MTNAEQLIVSCLRKKHKWLVIANTYNNYFIGATSNLK